MLNFTDWFFVEIFILTNSQIYLNIHAVNLFHNSDLLKFLLYTYSFLFRRLLLTWIHRSSSFLCAVNYIVLIFSTYAKSSEKYRIFPQNWHHRIDWIFYVARAISKFRSFTERSVCIIGCEEMSAYRQTFAQKFFLQQHSQYYWQNINQCHCIY